jgi:predicted ester cyclase
MSTEENKAIDRRIVEEVWNKKNLALVDELVDAKLVLHAVGGPDLKGPEGFKQFVNMQATAFPDFHITIEDMIAEGDKVVSRVTARGTNTGNFMDIAPTGKQMAITGIVISRFAGGKVVEGWLVNDALGAMQQLGVSVVPKKLS